MADLTFQEQLLEYLESQLEFEMADIEAHRLLSTEEKIEQGILIKDAIVLQSAGDEFIVSAEDDNSKLRAGDSVRIFYNGKNYFGEVLDLGINEITLSCNRPLSEGDIIDVEVIENTFIKPMINLMTKIIDGTKPGSNFIDMLAGIRSPKLKGIGALDCNKLTDRYLNNTSFNEKQKFVIDQTFNRPSVYCIQGPPGTGKTAVLSQIAIEFANQGRDVLVIANTHHAVNNAINKIAENNIHTLAPFDIVKVGNCKQSTQLHTDVFSADTYNEYLKERKASKNKGQADIVGMTLHSAVTNLGLRNTGFKPHIALVDEAGQIPMAYASIIGSFGCGCVIFIGDDKQMPPIFHPNLQAHPFSTSIFKYMCDKYPSLRNTLNITYRMNDDIAKLVSSCFYDTESEKDIIKSSPYNANNRSTLKTLSNIEDSVIKDILTCDSSIVICDVTPEDYDKKGLADSNIFEATVAVEIVKTFKANSIDSSSYAIITPYRRQSKLIRSMIGNEDTPLINTVECLQGQDVDTIIISFAAGDKNYIRNFADFILNPNRLNVMISRAKTKVIMLMSSELQKELIKRYPQVICDQVHIV